MAMQLIAFDTQNNQYPLDIMKGSPVTCDFNFKDIKDLKAKGSHTYTFRLPSSVANDKFFGHYFMVGSHFSGTGSYNPYVKKKAFLLQDSLEVFNGYIQLMNVYLKQGDRYEYECILFSSEVSFLDSIKGIKMSAMNYSEFTHTLNYTNVYNSWALENIDNGNLIWSLWDYGSGFASNDEETGYANYFTTVNYAGFNWNSAGVGIIGLDNLRPMIRVKTLFDKVLAFAGYTRTSTFMDSDFFNKVYCDIAYSKKNPVSMDIPGSYYSVQVTNSISQVITLNDGWQNMLLTADTEVTDITGAWSQDTAGGVSFSKYTAQAAGAVVFTIACNLTVPTQMTSGNMGFRLYKNPNLTTAPFSYFAVAPQYGVVNTNANFSATLSLGVQAGDEILVGWWNSSNVPQQDITIADLKITIQSNAVQQNNQVFIASLLGDLKMEDWVRGIIGKFNLVVVPNKQDPNNLIIEPYNDYVDTGKTKDWSDKIDFSKDVQIVPPTKYSGRKVKFFDAKSDDYVNQTLVAGASSTMGFQYGSYIEPTLQNEYADHDTEFSTMFIPTVNYPLNGMDINVGFYSCARFGVKDGVKSNAGGMALAFYCGTKQIDYYYRLAQSALTNGNFNVVPWFSAYSEKNFTFADVPNVVDINWHPGSVVAPQDWDNLPIKGLAIKYWRRFILDNYNVNSRMMIANMRLTPTDIQDFSFADVITINSQNYRVNSIKGYPVSSSGTCKVELLATFDSLSIPIVVNQDTDYTVDDDTGGDLTGDGTPGGVVECNFELMGFHPVTGIGSFVDPTAVTTLPPTYVNINADCCTAMGYFWSSNNNECYNSLPNDDTDLPTDDNDVIGDQVVVDENGNTNGTPFDEDPTVFEPIDNDGNVVVDGTHNPGIIHVINHDFIPIGSHNHTDKPKGVKIVGNKNKIYDRHDKVDIKGDMNDVRSFSKRIFVEGNKNKINSFNQQITRFGERLNYLTYCEDVVVRGDYANVFISGDRVQSKELSAVGRGTAQRGEFIRAFRTDGNSRDIMIGQFGLFTFTDGKYNQKANEEALRFSHKTIVKISTELIGVSEVSNNQSFSDTALVKQSFIITNYEQPIVTYSNTDSSVVSSSLGTPTLSVKPIIKPPYTLRLSGGGIIFHLSLGNLRDAVRWTLKVNYETAPLINVPDGILTHPTEISDCELWLDASNEQSVIIDGSDRVEQWKDVSGGTNHVLQSNNTYKPVYQRDYWHRPYLDFDGSTAILTSTDSDLTGLFAGNNTILVVYKSDITTAEYYGQILVGGTAGNSYVVRSGLRVNANGGTGAGGSDSITYSNQSSFTDFNACNIGSAGITNYSIAIGRRDGTAVKVLDGNGNSDTGTTGADQSVDRFCVGGSSYSTIDLYEFNGRISEIICYTRALTDAEINKAITYLKNKWDIL